VVLGFGLGIIAYGNIPQPAPLCKRLFAFFSLEISVAEFISFVLFFVKKKPAQLLGWAGYLFLSYFLFMREN
jgi:hypothetical protein